MVSPSDVSWKTGSFIEIEPENALIARKGLSKSLTICSIVVQHGADPTLRKIVARAL